MTISAADLYPEFVGVSSVQAAKTVLARVATKTPPRSDRKPSGNTRSPSVPAAKTSTGSLPQSAMKFLSIYVAASAKFGIPWQILASIHQTETSFGDTGSNPSNNGYGAFGPMQFQKPTWNTYKQDGNGDGTMDILNVSDAIFGAAALLKANHGTEGTNGLSTAIFSYNHAQWYVDKILAGARSFGWDGKVGSSSATGVVPTGTTTTTTTGSGVDASGMQTAGTAAAFAITLSGPTSDQQNEALLLNGDKSYLNDKPLIDFINQLCTASMRHYQSLPDGRFYAFFPDYFGSFNHRPPYWEVDDIEITNMSIDLSDNDLVTHVYVVGDTFSATSPPAQGGLPLSSLNKISSSGVISIFDAFNLNWLGSDVGDKTSVFADATKFLNKYGVRPFYEDAPLIHSHFFEMFMAFQRFMFLWARQFLTKCEFTFMPEIFPGGRLSFRDKDLICYVDSVIHEFDYVDGFTTTAQLSAPSANVNSKIGYPLGMVRPSTGGAS